MGPGVMLMVVVVALACAFAGQAIGRPKGYPGEAARRAGYPFVPQLPPPPGPWPPYQDWPPPSP
jgi:hypothetical protein